MIKLNSEQYIYKAKIILKINIYKYSIDIIININF